MVERLLDGHLVRVRRPEAEVTKNQHLVDQGGELAAAGTQVVVLLDDGKTYTLTEVDALINKFMKGAVK